MPIETTCSNPAPPPPHNPWPNPGWPHCLLLHWCSDNHNRCALFWETFIIVIHVWMWREMWKIKFKMTAIASYLSLKLYRCYVWPLKGQIQDGCDVRQLIIGMRYIGLKPLSALWQSSRRYILYVPCLGLCPAMYNAGWLQWGGMGVVCPPLGVASPPPPPNLKRCIMTHTEGKQLKVASGVLCYPTPTVSHLVYHVTCSQEEVDTCPAILQMLCRTSLTGCSFDEELWLSCSKLLHT